MAKQDKQPCSQLVAAGDRWTRWVQCSKNAKVERGGKWYCGTHDPVALAERRAKRDAEWKTRSEERNRQWKFESRAKALCEGVSPETLEQLGPGWLKKYLEKAPHVTRDWDANSNPICLPDCPACNLRK